MENSLIKDKPASGNFFPPQWRRRRYLVSLAIAFLLFWRFLTPSSHSSGLSLAHPGLGGKVDWSSYAYSQYATNQHYLCNSLMVFDSLQKLKSPADRLLFYPRTWDTDVSSSKDRTSQLLVLARDKYHVKLRPVEMYTLKHETEDDEETWDASINKLHAWNQGEYHRIIHLDSDITLRQNIDELFFLPLSRGSPIAMPRAYWKLDEPTHQGGGPKLTSLLIVLEPTPNEAGTLWGLASGLSVNNTISTSPTTSLFDMELLNSQYSHTALTLPHRPYALVTGEFRRTSPTNHTTYLGNTHESFSAASILAEAKLVHFSDWPLPKPWIMWPNNLMREIRPECEVDNNTPSERGCENRKVWMELYDDFRRRRKEVCMLLSVPAPEWPPRPKPTKRKGGGMGE